MKETERPSKPIARGQIDMAKAVKEFLTREHIPTESKRKIASENPRRLYGVTENERAASTRVEEVVSEKELHRVFSIRLRVFVREQGVPEEIELDEDDQRATHLLARVRGRAVGTARLVIKNGRAKIGRMAVLKSYRGKGVGKALLRKAVESARKSEAKAIYLHAQIAVIGFYEKMGFRCVGRAFIEAGIPHRKMVFVRDNGE